MEILCLGGINVLDRLSLPNSKQQEYISRPVVEKLDSVPEVKKISAEKQEPYEQQQQQNQQQHSREQTVKVIQSMNDFLKASSSHLKFEFHEGAKEYYVTLIDNKSNEVIREIPSKKVLDMYAAMTEYLGLLVDKKV